MDTLAYVRVSDPRQAATDKSSLEHQRAALNELAARLGRAVLAEGWYEEPGFSAGTADRPAFRRLLAYCEANPRPPLSQGVILCYKDDRFGRFDDPEESAYWRVHLSKCGWIVRFALNDDTSDLLARGVLRAIGAAQASLERQTIRQRARMGVRGAAAKGFWCNREPFGYRRLAVDPITGAARQLEAGQRKGPNEQLRLTPGPEAEVRFVQWLFGTYATGAVTLADLARQASSIYPKSWIRRTLHQMLLNPAYAGDTVWSRRATDGLAEPIVARDSHAALIDRDTVARVLAMLARNRKETSPARGGYPLSGLLVCAQCGSAFIGGGGRRGGESPDAFRFYKDAGYAKHPRCPGRMMTFLRRDVEPRVIEAIAHVIEQQDLAPLIRDAFDRLLRAGEGDLEAQRRSLEAQQETEEARLERLLAAIADGVVQEMEARQQVAAIRRRLEDARIAAGRLKFDERRLERLDSERERLTALALDFRGQAKRMEGVELRELLRPWLESALVDKERMTLTLEVRRIPGDVSLFTSVRPPEQAATVQRVIRLKTRSEWATLREAAKRSRRAS